VPQPAPRLHSRVTTSHPYTAYSLHHSRTKTVENNANPYQFQHTNPKKSPKVHTLMPSSQTLHIVKYTTNCRSTPYPPTQPELQQNPTLVYNIPRNPKILLTIQECTNHITYTEAPTNLRKNRWTAMGVSHKAENHKYVHKYSPHLNHQIMDKVQLIRQYMLNTNIRINQKS
jgi:hypothetical protein